MILGLSLHAQTTLPPDVKITCPLSQADFAKWFESGTVTPNGSVQPADSVDFQSALCNFYSWSEQMFLWITSPTSADPKTRVLDSPVFFEVSESNNGQRTLIANQPGKMHNFMMRGPKPGPAGMQILRDKSGRPFLVKALNTSKNPGGKVNARGINEGSVELGQAGGSGTLMSQQKSFVYYSIAVNDVFAAFLIGQKTGKITASNFPTTAADRDAIVAFATTLGMKIPDANALAIETKTSWVEAASLPDTSGYIVIDAMVPNIVPTGKPDGSWASDPNNPTKKAKLALVGAHIVGSVAGHPEMIWATFEHQSNTPSATYSYQKTDGTTGTVTQSTSGNWTFCSNGSAGPFNTEKMKASGDSIIPTANNTVSPSDTLLENPWGSLPGSDPQVVANNTAVLSMNANIQQLLPSSDVRRNYLLVGAIWTNGQIPGVNNDDPPNLGSAALANSTMETYNQDINCFVCHSGGNLGGLSHIYSAIQAQLPPAGSAGK